MCLKHGLMTGIITTGHRLMWQPLKTSPEVGRSNGLPKSTSGLAESDDVKCPRRIRVPSTNTATTSLSIVLCTVPEQIIANAALPEMPD